MTLDALPSQALPAEALPAQALPAQALLASYSLEQHTDLGHQLHLHTLLARGHRHVVLREVGRRAPDGALPERATVLQTVASAHARHVIAEIDDALVLLSSWQSDARIIVSGHCEPQLTGVAEEILARVPVPKDDGRVEVVFSDASTGSRTIAVDARPWPEVRPHYPPDVQAALDELVAHRPEVSSARRLVLWHGEPGTGKTTAVRALLQAWRLWADAVVVTDPDSLLRDGRYLRRMLLDVDDDDRWKLFVLEDAEALLRKQTGGGAMSKLLNLADGLLGQGLRCLFLITTNEPLGVIHPAVVRPGRCLANVEFGPLPASQAAGLLGRAVGRPMTLAEVMTQAPVETDVVEAAVGQYL